MKFIEKSWKGGGGGGISKQGGVIETALIPKIMQGRPKIQIFELRQVFKYIIFLCQYVTFCSKNYAFCLQEEKTNFIWNY